MDWQGHIEEPNFNVAFKTLSAHILVWFAILVAINLQTSYLTPPFGFALFYLRSVAPPEMTLRDIYRGIQPFVAMQLFVVILALLFPAIILWLPFS